MRTNRLGHAVCALAALAVLASGLVAVAAQGPTAQEVLDRVRAAWQGDSFHSLVELEVSQNGQTTSYRLEVWTQGQGKALLRILAPENEAGSGYLMDDKDLWFYSPTVGTAVKLPSIALADSVFGAGPALDDLLRSTLSQDYTVSMETQPSGYALTLTPRPQAAVVYGHLEIDVGPDYALRDVVYYDQRGNVLRAARFSDDLTLDDRVVPTTVTIVESNGDTTIEHLIDPQFGVELDASLFTVQSLETPR